MQPHRGDVERLRPVVAQRLAENHRTAAALSSAGYEYQHVYGLNQWHCGNKEDGSKPDEFAPSIWTETLASTLAWIWEGWEDEEKGVKPVVDLDEG